MIWHYDLNLNYGIEFEFKIATNLYKTVCLDFKREIKFVYLQFNDFNRLIYLIFKYP